MAAAVAATCGLSFGLLAAPTYALGPAANVSLALSKQSIPANGTSTTTAKASVTDALNLPVARETVVFSSTDPGEAIGSVTDHGNGTYTATITSSTTVGTPTITATDTSSLSRPSGQATLTQTEASSTTYLTVPGSAITNQQITLIATVISNSRGTPPAGAIAFLDRGAAIAGCGSVPVTKSNPTVTCQTSFPAASSPEELTARFTAAPGRPGSTSAPASLVVGKASTFTSLAVPSQAVDLGQTVTYTAAVGAAQARPVPPGGTVMFLDGGSPIASCAAEPLSSDGIATCTTTYTSAGQHAIRAFYRGDVNFGTSTSLPAQPVTANDLPATVLGTINSTMLWSFYYTPLYTTILRLWVSHAPIGARILMLCHGGGCPFARHSTRVTRPKRCAAKCRLRAFTGMDVVGPLSSHHLQVGAKVTIEILWRHWAGKVYVFTIRAGRTPRIRITCLAPEESRFGVGC